MKKTPLAKAGPVASGGGKGPAPAPRIPTGDVQSDNPEPPVKQKPDDGLAPLDRMKKEQDDRLDALLRGEDPVKSEPEPIKKEPEPEPIKKEPEPEPVTKEPEPEPEPVKKEESKDGEEIDFDKPPEGSSQKERETAAQVRARENGKALETLKTQHQETLLELERKNSEIETLKKSTAQPQYEERDFIRHPDVEPIRQSIINERNTVAQTQTVPGVGKVVMEKYGNYMDAFLERSVEPDESKAQAMDAELRNTIAEDFKDAYKESKGDDYDTGEMNLEARDFIKDVLQLLVRNSGKTQEIREKIAGLASKAREGMLAQGVDVYQHHENDLFAAMNVIPAIPEAVRNEAPYSAESTVAALLKEPAWKERFEATKKQVASVLLGPKVLTQAEIDNMNTAGVDVRDFSKKRQKSWLDNRRKMSVNITKALLLLGVWEDTARKAAAFDDSNGELDALSRGKPKSEDPKPPVVEAKKASEFRSAIEDVLDEVERR